MDKRIRIWRRRYLLSHAWRASAGLVAIGFFSLLVVLVAGHQLTAGSATAVSAMGFASLLLLGVLVASAVSVLLINRQRQAARFRHSSGDSGSPAHQLGRCLGRPVERWNTLEPLTFGQADMAGDVPPHQLCGRLGSHGVGLSRSSSLVDSPLFDAWLANSRLLAIIDAAESATFELPVADRMGSIGHLDRYSGKQAAAEGAHRREIIDLVVTVHRTGQGIRVQLEGMTGPLVPDSVKSIQPEWQGATADAVQPNPYRFDLGFEIREADLEQRVRGEALTTAIRQWMARVPDSAPRG